MFFFPILFGVSFSPRLILRAVPVSEWNSEFWRMKEEIVGVMAPVDRTPDHLDPPSLFHICQDYDMIR